MSVKTTFLSNVLLLKCNGEIQIHLFNFNQICHFHFSFAVYTLNGVRLSNNKKSFNCVSSE